MDHNKKKPMEAFGFIEPELGRNARGANTGWAQSFTNRNQQAERKIQDLEHQQEGANRSLLTLEIKRLGH